MLTFTSRFRHVPVMKFIAPSCRPTVAAIPFAGLFSLKPHSQVTASIRSFSQISGYDQKVCMVLGGQWGDEGKGKLVDVLASKYDIVARFNGGANAGHTLVVDGQKFVFHLLPCGLLYPTTLNVLGNGVVMDPEALVEELRDLTAGGIDWKGRLIISDRAHMLLKCHKIIDGLRETWLEDRDNLEIGTTKKGIGPCYASKATRHGVRVGEILHWNTFKKNYKTMIDELQKQYKFEYNPEEELAELDALRKILVPMVKDTVHLLNQAYADGKTILTEGANAALLDIDFGTYPYVTSSATTAGGAATGLGLAPSKLKTIIGVVKAYTTRVGAGPFPSELTCEIGDHLQETGFEFGATTGRRRRCGWLDMVVVNYGVMLNGYTSINITKLDVLNDLDTIKLGVSYSIDGTELPHGMMPSHLDDLEKVTVNYEEFPGWKCDLSGIKTFDELPEAAKKYILRIEELSKCQVSWIGIGPNRDEMVTKGFSAQ